MIWNKIWWLLLGSIMTAFTPPDSTKRTEAIGPLDDIPAEVRPLFSPEGFEPIERPGPHDWLANHPERGQTFLQFAGQHHPRPEGKRRTIYIQPIGSFSKQKGPPLEVLRRFAEAYFMLPVKVNDALDIEQAEIERRKNPYTGKLQLFAPDILDLLKNRLPPDAFCMLGVTMEDLYPHPDWNFVFGLASFTERVGVFSFARYRPDFYGENLRPGWKKLLLLRSMKVLAHEIGHMFGMEHCIFFRCGMNGSNHLAESDSRPIHLCPVCLRKLMHAVGFDPVARYRRLMKFYRSSGFERQAEWTRKRLGRVRLEEGRTR